MRTTTHHVLPRLASRTEVDLTTVVDDENLVELLVDTFTGLVEGDEGRHLVNVGEDAEGLGVVESGGGVETTRAI
jgi:hypothetical protein